MEYEIVGGSMQIVNLKLNQGEKFYVDAGKLVSKSDTVTINSKLGGGGGLIKGIMMEASGTSAFLTECTAEGGDGVIALAGVIPGKVKPIELKEGESIMVEHFAFLGTNDASKLQVKSSFRGLLAQAGLFLEQFDGPVTVFLHVCGDVIEYDLQEGSAVSVDPGHIAAFSSTTMPQFTAIGGIKNALFSGEGLYLARFTGPAKLYLHSISRLKLEMAVGVRRGK
ncbi:MAG: AIM24 family protein [Methanothrix sp.]